MEIPTIDIKNLKNYIISNIDSKPETLTIYHFIIGSAVYEPDITSSDPNIRRNHECPKIVEQLFINPEQQFSPTLINSLSTIKDNTITIRQVLVLIDPSYRQSAHRQSAHRQSAHRHNTQSHPVGLFAVLKKYKDSIDTIDCLTTTSILEHNEFNKTTIVSKLEPIIVPCDITEEHIIQLKADIEHLRRFYPSVINIIDCSSNTVNNLFNNSFTKKIDNWIYVTKPECMINDEKLQYNPILTISKDASKDASKDRLFTTTSLNSLNSLRIRWINYNDDIENNKELCNDLKVVSDFCPYSKNLYNFLITLYKVRTIEYSLFSIYKVWTYTEYKIDYKFNTNESTSTNVKSVTVNLSKLSFEDFVSYWKHKEFKELPVFNTYDIIIIRNFIDYFLYKYTNITGLSYLGLNPSIIDYLKVEAYSIFTELGIHFPNDCKYSLSPANDLKRNDIKTYLNENKCVL